MAEVRWSVAARNDLEEIEDFIARDSPARAIAFVDALVASTDRLEVSPRVGREVPEFGREELREMIFRDYRVIYLVRDPFVTILRVIHGARDLRRLLPQEPWVVDWL